MLRFVALFLSACAVAGLCRAGDDAAELKSALALQRVMQKVIADVEPSVACILVSRSDAYQRYGLALSSTNAGKLGGVDPRLLANLPGVSAEKLPALRKKLDLSDPGHVPESFGSGVVIDSTGLILTNYHVVSEAAKIFVRLPDGTGSYADIHAADPRSDLAVLRLLAPHPRLKVISFGDGSKCARGQFILSIANPYAAGFRDGKPSASWGIISNLRRHAPAEPSEVLRAKTLDKYGILLQMDARLNLGCSGGALVNLRGEMIGLTTALAAIHGGETPGGFAVPLDAGMRRIIDVLKRGEEVEYGFLGVVFRGEEKPGAGAVVGDVTSGSPAERQARLRAGDIILKVDDQPVREWDDLFLALGTHLVGSKVKLEVRRLHGGQGVVEVELAKFFFPGKKIASSLGKRPYFRGLRVDYTSVLAVEQKAGAVYRGVLISEIQPFSPAAAAKLKSGEIITRVNGREVNTPAEFYDAAALAAGRIELTLAAFGFNTPAPKVVLP
jgi:serine protease Do